MTGIPRRFFAVTPVLNGAQYLPAALACIDAQSCGDWIHIVVDGGSSDATLDIVHKSIETEPRRRLIAGKDRGLYDGLFKGFEAFEAAGATDQDICLWLNADDYLTPWAFATMRLAFEIYGADWVTGQPAQWDSEGRLTLIEPRGWYPRWCLANGWFNPRGLGSVQQESTFFSLGLLRQLDPAVVEKIRGSRLAGDFLLWRELARFCPLHAAPTLIGGFRLHGANLSIRSAELYIEEARRHGAVCLPGGLRQAIRFIYRAMAAIAATVKARHPLIKEKS